MNWGAFNQEVKKRNAEDAKDVQYILNGLKRDGYKEERLNKLLKNAHAYEKMKYGGSRGNRNMIKAAELLLAELQNKLPQQQITF